VALLPGAETSGAIAAGTWGMAVGGTDRLVEAALATLPEEPSPRLLATGAWGAAWASTSRHPGIEVDTALVHRGMRVWAARA
jgi:pantothenate kinase type III